LQVANKTRFFIKSVSIMHSNTRHAHNRTCTWC